MDVHITIKQRNWQKALKHARIAVNIKETNPKAHYRMAEAFMGLQDWNNAKRHSKKALKISPNDTAIQYQMHQINSKIAHTNSQQPSQPSHSHNQQSSQQSNPQQPSLFSSHSLTTEDTHGDGNDQRLRALLHELHNYIFYHHLHDHTDSHTASDTQMDSEEQQPTTSSYRGYPPPFPAAFITNIPPPAYSNLGNLRNLDEDDNNNEQ